MMDMDFGNDTGRPGVAVSPSGKRSFVNFVDRGGGKVGIYLRKPPYNWHMGMGWVFKDDAEAIKNFAHRGWQLTKDE